MTTPTPSQQPVELTKENLGNQEAKAAERTQGTASTGSAHTQGPWHVSGRLSRCHHHYDSGARAIVAGEDEFSPLVCITSHGWADGSTSDANALLIAAAPKLLHMLRVALADFELRDLGQTTTAKQIRAAITFASGGKGQ